MESPTNKKFGQVIVFKSTKNCFGIFPLLPSVTHRFLNERKIDKDSKILDFTFNCFQR